jgi:hypothetical protein
MSRPLTSFSLSIVAFFTTVTVGTANANECKTDSDCATGFECVLAATTGAGTGGSTGSSAGNGGSEGAACAGPDCAVSTRTPPVAVDGGSPPAVDLPLPVPMGDAGLTTPVVTTGICRWKTVTCTSKADCPANLDCVKQTVTIPRPTCAPDSNCDNSPQSADTGTCKAVCNVDSDCPSPLTCKLQGQECMSGASKNADGTVTTMPTTCSGGTKICTYQPVTCSTDSECADSNYQCAKVSETKACTGAAPSGCSRAEGNADVACTTTPAEPPVCTAIVVNNCEPKQFKCDAGQACPAGWTCFDFTSFETKTVAGWTETPYGKACLPDGLILGLYGYSSGGGVGDSSGYGSNKGSGTLTTGTDESGQNAGTGGTSGGTTPPQTGPVPASDDQENAAGNGTGSETATTKVRGGGCAMGGVQSSALGLWLTLGLAGMVLRLVRRRK